MSKAELLRLLRAEWGQWEQLLALVPPERYEVPMRPGGWCLRDLLAHLVWYEQECLALLREGAVKHPEMWGRSYDDLNADIWRAAQGVPAATVLAQARACFHELYDWVAAADAATLASKVALPGEDPVARSRQVEINSFGHYREHVDDLRTWLEGES